MRTYGRCLQHECDNAKEVYVCIVHGELDKDCSGVHVKPCVVIKVLKDSIGAWKTMLLTDIMLLK